MKIELARHSGFCAGVRKAVNKIVKEISNSSDEILIHGPLIHNQIMQEYDDIIA
jgi:4-hydroxy-3-methylbut-2-enyl diphosphate reductase IspH